MKNIRMMMVVGALLSVSVTGSAQEYAEGEVVVHDRARGESSLDTQAPDLASLREAIAGADSNPSRFTTMLEYGERVECYSCVPAVQRLLLSSSNAQVRESAAWWLRRRPFAIGAVFVQMRDTLASDGSDTRRQYAAEALGTLMDVHALAPLSEAATTDGAPNVRAAAVRSLGRLNIGRASHAIAMALGDSDVTVQAAALQAITEIGFFDEVEPIMGLLGSTDASIRRQAARAIGLYHVTASTTILAAMLVGDTDMSVRAAAAWALGRLGTAEAREALLEGEALPTQTDDRVLDAIRMAIRSSRG
ncbi:MAG: HEAT repeat domain-containing protein [Deltaproteobacteria bacterium]|nr:HEAT repeat domain-containing protein [Deltaproteobacteria bacterium]